MKPRTSFSRNRIFSALLLLFLLWNAQVFAYFLVDVEIDPEYIKADGASTSTITVSVRVGQTGQPEEGARVVFGTPLNTSVSPTSAYTDSNGQAQAILTSGTTPGRATINVHVIGYMPGYEDWYGIFSIDVCLVKADISATDLYGNVTEGSEETPGAYIHYNIDDDNANSTEDKEETGPVSQENDILSVVANLEPQDGLWGGTVIMEKGYNDKLIVWKNPAKGSNQELSFDINNQKKWLLSDAGQRADFNNVKNSLYAEGFEDGASDLTIKFYDPNDNLICSDKVNYTFIAAKCGRQPSSQEREIAEALFPNIIHCEWSITEEEDVAYNCIAWSIGETAVWYNPISNDNSNPNKVIIGIDETYGDDDGIFRVYAETFTDENENGVYDYGEDFIDGSGDGSINGIYDYSDIDEFYRKKRGWKPIATSSVDASAMYYSGYHGAKKKDNCNCGAGKWIMYESKCGEWVKIEHADDQLNGGSYGSPEKYYK